MKKNINIGTRDSQLALWQTDWVKERLQKRLPEIRFETQMIKTTGDRVLDIPLAQIGEKALFTKELDIALLRGEIDLAVHSLKDLPTQIPEGLTIAAVTERWDVRDALISRNGRGLKDLPTDATIATGSLRRTAQLLHFRPDFQIVDLRGNLNTRFRKFDERDWDAMILAVAGIERLGWQQRISEKIPLEIMLPAVGQGSFAVVCREDDFPTRKIVQTVNDPAAETAATAERAFLRTLEGGCQVPIGAYARVENRALHLAGCVCSLDGREMFRSFLTGNIEEAEKLGITLAEKLLKMGAGEILEEIKQNEGR